MTDPTPHQPSATIPRAPHSDPEDERALVRGHHWTLAVIRFLREQWIEAALAWHVTETRLGRVLGPALIALLAAGETALAYQGLTLAVPAHPDAHGGWPLVLVERHGAMLAAVAIGVGSAVGATAVGWQLRKASRGLVADPSSTHDGS